MSHGRIAKTLNHLNPSPDSCISHSPKCLRLHQEPTSNSHLNDGNLPDMDPEVYELIEKEERRQFEGLELIASENFTSKAVMQAVGSCLTNKYSEGLPGARYYGGNKYIDILENLTKERALQAFRLDPEKWAVNVQSYSGSTANLSAFLGIVPVHGRIMGLALTSGGHLSHGYYRGTNKINVSSAIFESLPYHVDADTGVVDYSALERNAKIFHPKLIISGASAYPREWDYAKLRATADGVGAYLLADIAHFSGLVASQVVKDPFDYADVVTMTTHKSLRGPRAALIFCRKELEKDINFAVFPGTQGGPHNHSIAGICVQLKQVMSPEFRDYSRRVVENAKHMAGTLIKMGHDIVTGGTDNHLILWDLKPHKLTGSKFQELCDHVHITLNKNSVHGDKSPFNPGGVRLGTPALTTRGFNCEDMTKVCGFLDEAVKIALRIQIKSGKKLKKFKDAIPGNEEVLDLANRVREFAIQFEMPGQSIKCSFGGRPIKEMHSPKL